MSTHNTTPTIELDNNTLSLLHSVFKHIPELVGAAQLIEELFPTAHPNTVVNTPDEPFDLDAMVETAKLTTSLFIDRLCNQHRSELRYAYENQKIRENHRWEELTWELRNKFVIPGPPVEVRLYGGGGPAGFGNCGHAGTYVAGGGGAGGSAIGCGGGGRAVQTFVVGADSYGDIRHTDSEFAKRADAFLGPNGILQTFQAGLSYQVGDRVPIDGKPAVVTQAGVHLADYSKVVTDAYGNKTVVVRNPGQKSPEPQVETPSSLPEGTNTSIYDDKTADWGYDSTFEDYND